MIEVALTHSETQAMIQAARRRPVDDLDSLAAGAAVLDEALLDAIAIEAHEAEREREGDEDVA